MQLKDSLQTVLWTIIIRSGTDSVFSRAKFSHILLVQPPPALLVPARPASNLGRTTEENKPLKEAALFHNQAALHSVIESAATQTDLSFLSSSAQCLRESELMQVGQTAK